MTEWSNDTGQVCEEAEKIGWAMDGIGLQDDPRQRSLIFTNVRVSYHPTFVFSTDKLINIFFRNNLTFLIISSKYNAYFEFYNLHLVLAYWSYAFQSYFR